MPDLWGGDDGGRLEAGPPVHHAELGEAGAGFTPHRLLIEGTGCVVSEAVTAAHLAQLPA